MKKFTEICSQYARMDSDNGLALDRRQANVWTDDVLVDWIMYASFGLDVWRPYKCRSCVYKTRTLSSDPLEPNHVRPSADTLTTQTLHVFSSEFLSLPRISNTFSLRRHQLNDRRNPARSRGAPCVWMMTSSNGNRDFPCYWPFVWGIHRSPVNFPTKASDAEFWCFLWSAPE